MARMYARRRGKHGSKKPPVRVKPRWLKIDSKKVEELVIKLAKEGYSSAMIGLILRDQYGIPDVKAITGKKISKIMKEHGVYPQFPEDLLNLFRKAVNLYEHLQRHKGDKHSRRGYQLLLCKINRLLKYYKREGVIPKDFKFDIEKIKILVER